jgi:UDP-N-acetylglucosamine 2-epimerase
MKAVSIVGARPQFIKLGPVSRAIRARHSEIIINTGQHYDYRMAGVFLQELGIPEPDYNLGCGSGSHAEQTAAMLTGIEKVLLSERPDVVVVYGDTNSTIAGALAAAKLHMRIAHVEAGLRSWNRQMPEEINRVLTDHVSTDLLCPTDTAVRNLEAEGITRGVHWVGDVMYDAVLQYGANAGDDLLGQLGVTRGNYILATIHRASNTDDPEALRTLLDALGAIDETVIFPVHPRTRAALQRSNLGVGANIRLVEPFTYLEMLAAERNARMILTDSGGVQKEAYFLGVPCVTLREETEWTELVDAGWNKVVGLNGARILEAVREWRPSGDRPPVFGEGDAAARIVEVLEANGTQTRAGRKR